jgi:tripeptidyl-peptidase-1
MQYHWFSALAFLTAVLLADFVTPLEPWDNMLVKHTWHAIPVNWESLGHPPAGTRINLYLALKPERESALIDTLSEVSDPTHLRHVLLTTPPCLYSRVPLLCFRYGAHLSAEQVAELVRPYPDTLELISAWLKYHGIRPSSISTTHGGGWLTVTDVFVSQANQLLGASYQLYRNTKSNGTIVRTVGYALPPVLHTHIQAVAPTTYFASMRVTRQTKSGRSFEAAPAQAQASSNRFGGMQVVPDSLHWLYKTFGYWPSAADENRLAVVGFNGEFPSQEDLTSFMNRFFTQAQAATFTAVQVNDGVNDPNGFRANTDVQYAAVMAFPTPLIFYSVGGGQQFGPNDMPIAGDAYLEWFNHVIGEPNIPQTISISYGNPEPNMPEEYVWALCDLFEVLGVQGVSVLVASGDSGVGEGDCQNHEGITRFMPQFPSSCTCGVLSPPSYKSLTRPPWFRRSLGH